MSQPICRHCGTSFEAEYLYCGGCGAPRAQAEAKPECEAVPASEVRAEAREPASAPGPLAVGSCPGGQGGGYSAARPGSQSGEAFSRETALPSDARVMGNATAAPQADAVRGDTPGMLYGHAASGPADPLASTTRYAQDESAAVAQGSVERRRLDFLGPRSQWPQQEAWRAVCVIVGVPLLALIGWTAWMLNAVAWRVAGMIAGIPLLALIGWILLLMPILDRAYRSGSANSLPKAQGRDDTVPGTARERMPEHPGMQQIVLDHPLEYRDTNATRLLCAGTHLNAHFCDQVVDELVKQRHRRVAPAYGYNCVMILAHALSAKRRRRMRMLGLLAGLAPLVPAALDGKHALEWGLLAAWCWWVVIVVERVACVHMLKSQLSRRAGDTGSRTQAVPGHRVLSGRANEITVQSRSTAPVCYSGFSPFIGAGTLTRDWSFSVVIQPADPQNPVLDFTTAELMDHVCARVTEKIGGSTKAGIAGLTATRRLYSTLLRPSGFDTARLDVPGEAGPVLAGDLYDSAREYVCVSIGSWEQELVTSIFVGFDIRGDTLHTEMHSYALLPIKAGFHEVDRLPEELTFGPVLAIALMTPLRAILRTLQAAAARSTQAFRRGEQGSKSRYDLLTTLSSLLSIFLLYTWLGGGAATSTIVIRLLLAAGGLWLAFWLIRWGWDRYTQRMEESAADRPVVGGNGERVTDFGARASIRELAASEQPHHYFQAVDQDKYTKIIERRVTDFIIDFLKKHRIETSEFDTRRQAVFNYGIMITGGGQITNTGAIAVGASSAATMTDTE